MSDDARKVLDLDAAATRPEVFMFGLFWKARSLLPQLLSRYTPGSGEQAGIDLALIHTYRTAAPALAREVLALREQVSRLTAERDEVVAAMRDFRDTVEKAEASRGPQTGMHVPYHGDFACVAPSTRKDLLRWADRFARCVGRGGEK